MNYICIQSVETQWLDSGFQTWARTNYNCRKCRCKQQMLLISSWQSLLPRQSCPHVQQQLHEASCNYSCMPSIVYRSVHDKCHEKVETACLITTNITTTTMRKPHKLHVHTKRRHPMAWQRLSNLRANQLQQQKVSLQATNAADIIMAIITTKAVMTPCATTAAYEA